MPSLPVITLVPFDAQTDTFDHCAYGDALVDELCAAIRRSHIHYGLADERLDAATARLDFLSTTQKREEFLGYYGVGECYFAVDRARGVPVGFVIVQPVADRSHCYEIGRFILAGERDKKYGRSMLTKIEGVLMDRGACEVVAVSDATNTQSHRSLMSTGFIPRDPEPTDRIIEFPSARCIAFSKSLQPA